VTKDIILDVQEQEVITRDNAVILTNAIAFIKVTDPVKAVYGVTDFSEAIRNLIMTTLRSIVGEMELDEALSSRDKIKARLRESIADEAVDWGLTVKSVEIQDIKPSQSMQKGHGNAGCRRARAQGRGDPRRRRQAGGHSRSRGAPGIGQARRQRAGHAGRSLGRSDPPHHGRNWRPDRADVLHAR
jgi:regulator of protease activity HflC (stomatin/prohibitin superfamily)